MSPEDFAKEMEHGLALERAEEQRREEELRAACARGDHQAIDRLLRLDRKDDDALGHEVSLDGMAAKRSARMNQSPGSKGITLDLAKDQIMAESEGDVSWLRHRKAVFFSENEGSVDRDGRSAMHRLLGTPKAAILTSRERRVARLWSDGLNQTEIAAKLRLSQPTVHRIVESAKIAMSIAL
jgi:DNA-binding CsgD family transcriptional regulator